MKVLKYKDASGKEELIIPAFIGMSKEEANNTYETKLPDGDSGNVLIKTDSGVEWGGVETLIEENNILTQEAASELYQPIGDYLTEHQPLDEYAKTADVDSKIANAKSELIGGASSAYDTLKEIEDYIKKDGEAAAALNQEIANLKTGQAVVNSKPTLAWGGTATVGTVGGTALQVTMPANPNTDTKVTAVGNHYTPSGGSTISASGGTATNATASGNAQQVVTGVTVDAAGHVTGVTSKGIYSTDTTYSAMSDSELKTGTATTSRVITAKVLGDNYNIKTNTITIGNQSYTPTAYGTCATAAATAAKVVTASDWVLRAGAIIVIKFTYTNTASNPTLNVNSTGAKSIWYNTAVLTTASLGYAGTANRPMAFMYDGTNYVFIGWSVDNNTTYSALTDANLKAGTETTARLVTAKLLADNYKISGGVITIGSNSITPLTAHQSLSNYVTLNGAQTISGAKTFTAKPTIDMTGTAVADKAQVGLLSTKYKTNDITFTSDVISALGSTQTVANNFDVRLGSTTGATWISAGESGKTLMGVVGIANTENVFITADSHVKFYTNCANDSATYTNTLNVAGTNVSAGTNNTVSLGTSSIRYSNVYTQLLNVAGASTLSGLLTASGGAVYPKRVYTASTSGALSISGSSYDVAIITLTGNVSGITLSAMPQKGKDVTVILYGNGTARTVAVAHSGVYKTNTGAALSISVPANGYAEVNLLYDGTNVWVRGV